MSTEANSGNQHILASLTKDDYSLCTTDDGAGTVSCGLEVVVPTIADLTFNVTCPKLPSVATKTLLDVESWKESFQTLVEEGCCECNFFLTVKEEGNKTNEIVDLDGAGKCAEAFCYLRQLPAGFASIRSSEDEDISSTRAVANEFTGESYNITLLEAIVADFGATCETLVTSPSEYCDIVGCLSTTPCSEFDECLGDTVFEKIFDNKREKWWNLRKYCDDSSAGTRYSSPETSLWSWFLVWMTIRHLFRK